MNVEILGKPRIRIRFGVWCCVTLWPFICGCAYSPADAYEAWKKRVAELGEQA